jgi:hypothetical protein
MPVVCNTLFHISAAATHIWRPSTLFTIWQHIIPLRQMTPLTLKIISEVLNIIQTIFMLQRVKYCSLPPLSHFFSHLRSSFMRYKLTITSLSHIWDTEWHEHFHQYDCMSRLHWRLNSFQVCLPCSLPTVHQQLVPFSRGMCVSCWWREFALCVYVSQQTLTGHLCVTVNTHAQACAHNALTLLWWKC